jgi:hypothetical protein
MTKYSVIEYEGDCQLPDSDTYRTEYGFLCVAMLNAQITYANNVGNRNRGDYYVTVQPMEEGGGVAENLLLAVYDNHSYCSEEEFLAAYKGSPLG